MKNSTNINYRKKKQKKMPLKLTTWIYTEEYFHIHKDRKLVTDLTIY